MAHGVTPIAGKTLSAFFAKPFGRKGRKQISLFSLAINRGLTSVMPAQAGIQWFKMEV